MDEGIIQDYYCYVDKFEQVNEEIHLLFDGVSKNWYEEFLVDNFFVAEAFEKIIPQIIFAKLSFKQLSSFFLKSSYELNDFRNTWIHLKLTHSKTDFPAELYVENNNENPEPIFMYVQSAIPLRVSDPFIDANLKNKISLNDLPDATESELQEALKHEEFGQSNNYVSVYDVGQGNLNAICSFQGYPILYYDMGGGCYQNRHTYQIRKNICFSSFKTIVLSHWDADHLSTAKRYYGTPEWNYFNNRTWIAPRQVLGPSNLKFAMRIRSVGNLLIWPSSYSKLKFTDGEIFLCNGPDKNHSGLALMTNLNKGKNNISKVLLPADAAYKYIPLPSEIEIEGIVATHHGADFHHSNSPTPIACGTTSIAYSYGVGNSYSHPSSLAEAAHFAVGWINRKDSFKGNIGFVINVAAFPTPCGNQCNLTITQTF